MWQYSDSCSLLLRERTVFLLFIKGGGYTYD
jgi:hypothetical protein